MSSVTASSLTSHVDIDRTRKQTTQVRRPSRQLYRSRYHDNQSQRPVCIPDNTVVSCYPLKSRFHASLRQTRGNDSLFRINDQGQIVTPTSMTTTSRSPEIRLRWDQLAFLPLASNLSAPNADVGSYIALVAFHLSRLFHFPRRRQQTPAII